jgi:outer membrane protein OmpA-like peptidoglycan-associated protein
MHMKIKTIGIGFLSFAMLGGQAWSGVDTRSVGRLAMPLTQEGGTARAMSMGSAGVAVPQGASSLFWNPAALSRMVDCLELGLHHNSGLGDSNHETAVLGMPMGVLGGFAASLNYVDNGTFEGRDEAGNQTGNFGAGDMGAGLGWGKRWLPGVSAGVGVKYNRQTLADKSYSAYAADVGLLWRPLSRFDVGLVYSNLGTKVADRLLDSGWRIGASYGLNKNLLLAASSELKPGGFDRGQIGIEAYVHPRVALRGGYMYDFVDSKLQGLTGLTAGLGVKIVENIALDYAYLPVGDLGISHRFSLTYRFLCPVEEAPPPTVSVAAPPPAVVPEPVAVVAPVIVQKLIVLSDNTHFEIDTAILTPSGVRSVRQTAQILRDNPSLEIRIAGYTSAAGSNQYNQMLSESRARAVEKILVKEGAISAGRITTIGYGELRPITHEPKPKDVNSSEARSNMQVLFEIVVR